MSLKYILLLCWLLVFQLSQSYSQEYTTDPNTILLYHLNEVDGNAIYDSSGNGYNGTATGSTIVEGKYNLGRDLNGAGWMEIPHNNSFNFSNPGSKFTAEAWINLRSFQHQAIFFKGNVHQYPYYHEWGILIEPDATVRFQICSDTTDGVCQEVRTPSILTLNKWTHIAGVWDGNKIFLYIDYVPVCSTLTSITSIQSFEQPLYIGYVGDGPMNGSIDEIRISNKARESWEFNITQNGDVVAYYPFNGNANDESGNGFHGTVVNATLTKDRFQHDNSAYYFNGASYISIPEVFSADIEAVTISSWIKLDALGTNRTVVYKGAQQGEMQLCCHDDRLCFYVHLSDGNWYGPIKYPNPPEIDKYYFIVGRYRKGIAAEFWVNGIMVDSISIPNYNLYIAGTASSIGSYNRNNSVYWEGIIDDIRIYTRSLSSTEIDSLYHEGGWVGTGTISGMKFEDENSNGIKDLTEHVLGDWTIRLFKNDVQIDSTKTSKFGTYSFWVNVPDTYTIQEEMTPDWIPTNPVSGEYANLFVDTSDHLMGKDFGNYYSINPLSGEYLPDSNTVLLLHMNEGEGNYVHDVSTQKNHGIAGGTTVMLGKYGNARRFLSEHDTINVSRDILKLPVFTAEAWIYLDSSSYQTHHILSNEHSGVDKGFLVAYFAPNRKIVFVVGSGVGHDYHLYSVQTIEEKHWYHIACTYDGDTMKIFLNGKEDAAALWSNLDYETETTYPFMIGMHNLNPSDPPNQFFNGIIDEVRISNKVRSAEEFNVYLNVYIAGSKFNDLNRNGNKDGDEPMIADWRIRLIKEGTQVDSTITDSEGTYTFNTLKLGTYTIREKEEANWANTYPTAGEYSNIIIDKDTIINGFDFGNYQYGSISGMKFVDTNMNHVKDVNEPGRPGWLINLTGTITASILTDENGYYRFDTLPLGTYMLSEEQTSGWEQTYPLSPGIYEILISGDTINHTEKNFGNFELGTISGYKFKDINRDGIKDNDEPGIRNWKIRLTGAIIDSTFTDENGYYTFSGLIPGTYTISEDMKQGWEQIYPLNPGTHIVNITISGQEFTDVNFGNAVTVPKVKLPLSFYNANKSAVRNIFWGIRSGASRGIWGIDPDATTADSSEGESELPSPMAGTFDIRFINPDKSPNYFGYGSWVDIRNFVSSTQSDTYKVSFQPGPMGYPVTFKWSKDLINQSFSGIVRIGKNPGNWVDMKEEDSLLVTNVNTSSLYIISENPTIPILYNKGWNMVSLPMIVEDARREILFPTSVSNLYKYDHIMGYLTSDSLEIGNGYWLKFNGVIPPITLDGIEVLSDTINVFSGWNMVGSLTNSVPVNSIESVPPGIIVGGFFGYNGSYYSTDALEPFMGYWVKVNQDGQLILSSPLK